ncbi:CHAT domain-containing protein [Subsaximicrobium wynnwilliamsii]|uniref:CHAT domain-containing protein n=1 Tax=Subsaximicrobium wynnwilliamsii TaxID=291179 RepID=A0A5C6ZKN3_9FLAO|nr:CHAT domain-containing protein [Subsaximicrobium wynnwilliamsii]TXD83836.1 CHAT domain-containing protein [Subsaximicrobium wynnwilliamsii]TXD89577.1 CHAT domain-containing protein [Subsaximicrobium wynnwilliamsii]TXE02632.1 CHAT domain-containing protein [Subsaximicrobium wynnwilliamsii]
MKGYSFCIFILMLSSLLQAQETPILNTSILDSLMLKGEILNAEARLNEQLAYIQSHNLNDSLYKYTYYVGKIELQKSDAKTASKKVDAFLDYINTKSKNKRSYYQALLKLADFYDEIGNNQKSLDITTTALKIIKEVRDATPEEIGKTEYNIGATYLSLGNVDQAKTNFQKALKRFESYKFTSKAQLSDGYNAVGATMWMSSKLDSASYYYSKAIEAIAMAKGDPIMNLYLATVIKSNISLLEYGQGNLDKAIAIQNGVISNYEKTIHALSDENVVSKAKRFQLRAISNMAVFYNEQGNLQKAHDLMLFAYQKKKTLREADDSDLGATLIQIGQSSLSLQNYDDAISYLNEGLKQFEVNAIENPYWKAAGFHALAEAHAVKKNTSEAKKYYEQSEQYFKEALGNDYDIEFLSFLRNKSLFLAENQAHEAALNTAQTGYDYVLKNGGDDNFTLVKQLLNLAMVNYKLQQYEQSLIWVDKANQYLNKAASAADSKQKDFHKPQLILLKALAQYELQPNKDTSFLKQQLIALDKAISLLEDRKTRVYKNEDLSILMTDYQSISNFSKKVALDLYQKTKEAIYLDKIIELNESAVYNRIRSRLNLKNSISFKDVSKPVLERELQLKNEMSFTLDHSENIQSFLDVEKEWQLFLDTLKTRFPKYYKMRYATISQPVKNLKRAIADHTTVVRYLNIDEATYAILINKSEKHLVRLNPKDLQKNVQALTNELWDLETSSELLHQLYVELWQPFEDRINTNHVIIIPNGQLFNLSFESLTPEKIASFKELETKSLLAKYIISYNYSLLLTNRTASQTLFSDNFIGFAPEFNSKMKTDYTLKIKDSITMDRTYLTLLPQPFSKNLAQNSSKFFTGESFINEKASKQLFTQHAKEHKIIHIGTHAESNNVSPELSRLIFAKNVKDSMASEDNSLYTYEIYNQNLSSNLAILTACETGKPTYQAGEGMISLAHAFNYAGSESILTSLWKIDEQSSAAIIENFYGYIKDGLPKDEALQKAKLDYIATAKGRTLSPQYWAGLVLIGDTLPIHLTSTSYFWYWMLGGLLVIFFLLVLLIKIKRSASH